MNEISEAEHECSCLCGNQAKGHIKVTDKISLPVCYNCREIIDPEHKMDFSINGQGGEIK